MLLVPSINAPRAALDLFLLKPCNELEMDGMNSFLAKSCHLYTHSSMWVMTFGHKLSLRHLLLFAGNNFWPKVN